VVTPTNPVATPNANTFTAPTIALVNNPLPPVRENVVLLPPTPAVPQPPKPDEPIVWLCDDKGVRRGAAGSPESERLIEQGVRLDDCADRPQTPPRQPGRPPAGTGMMCDANGRPRGRSSSPYVASLNRRGVQLQPCPQAAGNGNGAGAGRGGIVGGLVGRRGNRIGGGTAGNNAGMMCDTNGRPRGRSTSPYVASLNRRGVRLQPCGQGNGNANPANGNGNGNGILLAGNNAGMMCDANGRQRGRASSPYVRALTRIGTQLTPCPQGGAIAAAARPARPAAIVRPAARATDPGASSAPSSTTSSAPAWAISLIVVGSLLFVVLIVLAVRLTLILKA